MLYDEYKEEDEDGDEDWNDTQWAEPVIPTAGLIPQIHKAIRTAPHMEDSSEADHGSRTTVAVRFLDTQSSCSGAQLMSRMQVNDNKAGMQGLDKERINQIIYEASKGSKYFENEKKKEEQTKKRIEEQRQKMDKFTTVQLQQGTVEADKLLVDLENLRNLSHTIVHIDMDAFYAAVEMRDNPELKDKPMAVGGTAMLSTSNYHARKYGVRAAMPGFIGKKLCPDLVIVSTNFDKYTTVSKQVRTILADYDADFCPMSLDEAYLDITEHLERRQSMSAAERTYLCRKREFVDSREHCLCDLNLTVQQTTNYFKDFEKKSDESKVKEKLEVLTENGTNSTQVCPLNQNKSGDCNSSESLNTTTCNTGASENELVVTESLDENHNLRTETLQICWACGRQFPPYDEVIFGVGVEEAVREMRSRIEQRTRLTASAGIAPNMMLSKVCSDLNKPNGQYKIEPTREAVLHFIQDLSIRKICGIGKVSEALLGGLGVHTCTHLYQERALLYHLFSQISFNYFMRICLGIGSITVKSDSERKSMSTERTFGEINRPVDLYRKCEELCEALAEDLQEDKLKGKTVGIKIKTVNFEVHTKAQTLSEHTSDSQMILGVARELLRAEMLACAPSPLRLRLMGVRVSSLLKESMCHNKRQNTITGMIRNMANRPSPHSSNSNKEDKATSREMDRPEIEHIFDDEQHGQTVTADQRSDLSDRMTMGQGKSQSPGQSENVSRSKEQEKDESKDMCPVLITSDAMSEDLSVPPPNCVPIPGQSVPGTDISTAENWNRQMSVLGDPVESLRGSVSHVNVSNSNKCLNREGYQSVLSCSEGINESNVDENSTCTPKGGLSVSDNERKFPEESNDTCITEIKQKESSDGACSRLAVNEESSCIKPSEAENSKGNCTQTKLEYRTEIPQPVDDSRCIGAVLDESGSMVTNMAEKNIHVTPSVDVCLDKRNENSYKFQTINKDHAPTNSQRPHSNITQEHLSKKLCVEHEDLTGCQATSEGLTECQATSEGLTGCQATSEGLNGSTSISPVTSSSSQFMCPVCCKQTDCINLTQFNEHIDLCLGGGKNSKNRKMAASPLYRMLQTGSTNLKGKGPMKSGIGTSGKRSKLGNMKPRKIADFSFSEADDKTDLSQFCDRCKNVFCVCEKLSPEMTLPDNYMMDRNNVIKHDHDEAAHLLNSCKLDSSLLCNSKSNLCNSGNPSSAHQLDKAAQDIDIGVTEGQTDQGSLLVCPICNKGQKVSSLEAFNAHIDVCLSKGTISELLHEQQANNCTAKRSAPVTTPGRGPVSKKKRTSGLQQDNRTSRSIASFFSQK